MSSFLHSVCRWCYASVPLETLAEYSREVGIQSVELLGPADWPTLKKFGLTCAMSSEPKPATLEGGVNRRADHAALVPAYLQRIQECADAGVPNLIVFSGNRRGLGDEEGLEICAEFLKQIAGAAEQAGVTLGMELLNSRVDHPDYQCDHTDWGVELCRRVSSERVKLLYDIYHAQIMEGDVIRRIQQNAAWIAHYHTGGNPGRAEIDATQELNYPAIARAIHDTGFKGYVAQEFIPKRDWRESLAAAVQLCTVV
jgi:hydroxypyruvate isomerase